MMTSKLILTAFLINLVLPSSNLVHSVIMSYVCPATKSDQGVTRNSGASLVHSDVQQNFQSLIESVAKSDSRRNEVYRSVLQENVANGRQAFDAMKDEVQTIRRRNVDRRRDHVESGMHHSGFVSPIKRAAKTSSSAPILEDNDEKAFVAKYGTNILTDYDERAFVALYGNNNETSGVWQAVRNISSDVAKLRTLCYLAHRQTASTINDVIDTIRFESKTLTFTKYDNPALNRAPIRVDVVSYNVTRKPPFELPEHHFFHFTKGTKKDCVFYLIKWGNRKPIFRIGLHCCDVDVPE